MDNDYISSHAQMLLSGLVLVGKGMLGKADPAKPSHNREGAEIGTHAIMASTEANHSV